MTDQREPGPGGEPDLPTAGRRPPHTGEMPVIRLSGAAPGDEGPTVETVRPDPAAAPAPAEPATEQPAVPEPVVPDPDGPTRRLWPLTPEPQPAAGAAEDDEPTARLQPAARAEPSPPQPQPESAPPVVSPDAVTIADGVPPEAPATPPASPPTAAAKRRPSSAGALILALLALFGFTLVVQLRNNNDDEGLATARQEDLVRILSDLEARDSRLQSEISALETSQRQLSSGVAGRQAALDEASKRADELGLLAGTLPARGSGLSIRMDRVKASAILNAVQELRGSGGEVMQIAGTSGDPVRLIASSYFVDAEGGGIVVDGERLTGPYVVTVIGNPQFMQTALQIPGGVVASVNSGGGSVAMEQRALVEVTAVRDVTTLRYARPVS